MGVSHITRALHPIPLHLLPSCGAPQPRTFGTHREWLWAVAEPTAVLAAGDQDRALPWESSLSFHK